MASSWVDRVGVACERYGPGQLPGADRRTVGAGYACASGAVLATTAYVLLSFASGAVSGGGGDAAVGFGLLAVGAYTLVVPSAFVLGWAVWRFLPEGPPIFGAVAGAVTALLAYPVGTALVVVAMAVPRDGSLWIPPGERIVGSIVGGLLVGLGAFLLTFWLTLPIGAAAGYTYERVRQTSTESVDAGDLTDSVEP